MKSYLYNRSGFIPIVVIASISALILVAGTGVGLRSGVHKAIDSIEDEMAASKDFQTAISHLELLKNDWRVKWFGWGREELSQHMERYGSFVEHEVRYELAQEAVSDSDWPTAKYLLSSIGSDFIEYKKIESLLDEVEDKYIESRIANAVNELTQQAQQKIKSAEDSAKLAAEDAILSIQDIEKRVKQETEQQMQEFQNKIENSGNTLASVIKQWKPYVVHVGCDFGLLGRKEGSGTFMMGPDGDIVFITNEHVLTDGVYKPNNCTISFPETATDITGISTDRIKVSNEYDFGMLYPDSQVHRTVQYLKTIAGNFNPIENVCDSRPAIGEQVVILGYPGVGATIGITATQGIVSGYDNDYVVTDAKIERGNSGGAAIYLEKNCYLGLPTGVLVGAIESFGRILDVGTIVKSNSFSYSPSFYAGSSNSPNANLKPTTAQSRIDVDATLLSDGFSISLHNNGKEAVFMDSLPIEILASAENYQVTAQIGTTQVGLWSPNNPPSNLATIRVPINTTISPNTTKKIELTIGNPSHSNEDLLSFNFQIIINRDENSGIAMGEESGLPILVAKDGFISQVFVFE